jgi:hypothetical protein
MLLALPFAAALLGVAACGPREPAASAPSAAASESASAPASETSAQVVNATILTNGCQELGKSHARLAERAMYQLVEGCRTVPNGSAQFEATLLPGGRIDIAVPPGQPGIVPVCVLKHSLTHKVPLSRPCHLEVKIEQTSVPVAPPAASAPLGPDAGGR